MHRQNAQFVEGEPWLCLVIKLVGTHFESYKLFVNFPLAHTVTGILKC
jgi:hypothetical protein